MRENLIFSGIDKTISRAGDFEECEGRIQTFIREVMGSISKLIDRVHRLGRFRPGQSRPMLIVAKFTLYGDKEYVRQEAPKILIGTGYSVNEQFPQEIETRRKVLYPVAKSAQQNESNKVRLVHDKLYINGQLYLPEQTTYNTKMSQQHPQRRLSTHRKTRNYRTPSTQNSNRHTNGQLHIGKRFSQRPNPLANANAPLRFGPALSQPLTEISGQASAHNHNNISLGNDIQLSNKFAPLADNNEINESQTPQCTGKRKASSPVDTDQTTKKQLEFDSPDSHAARPTSNSDNVRLPVIDEQVSSV